MTAITTSAGLASFLAADMAPIREFGKAATLGVLVCLVYSLAFLPALVCVFPIRQRRGGERQDHETRFDRWLVAVGMYGAHHPWRVGLGALLLGAAAALSATGLTPSNDPISYFPPEDPFRAAFEYVDERLGGAMTLEVVVDGGEENAFYEPELMNRLQALSDHVDTLVINGDDLGRTISILDIAKETHQALNENDSRYYAVAQDRALLAQELLLFENSGHEDMERVIDPQFRTARFTIRTAWDDGNKKAAVIERVQRDADRILGDEASSVVTGAAALIARTVEATSSSLIRTYGLAFLVITPLMMLLIGSLRAGLVSMAPNLLPILLTLGLMPLVEAPLDIFTMMFGCIAIGLAVDDTLHMIHGFRAGMARHGDPYVALEDTLRTTGRALLFTSVVLSLGFCVVLLLHACHVERVERLDRRDAVDWRLERIDFDDRDPAVREPRSQVVPHPEARVVGRDEDESHARILREQHRQRADRPPATDVAAEAVGLVGEPGCEVAVAVPAAELVQPADG